VRKGSPRLGAWRLRTAGAISRLAIGLTTSGAIVSETAWSRHGYTPQDRFERLVRDIEASIDHFINAPLEGTFRGAHNALRALRKRCHLEKPPVRVLREELQKLPNLAIEYIGRRARVVIPRLFPGETIGGSIFDPPYRLATRLLAWAISADDQILVKTLRILTAEGGRIVTGRSRGRGKRSRSRFEPSIMGEVRGAGTRDHKGGAPTRAALHDLVMHLALDWLPATEEPPKPGRSDRTGFGDLVHSVVQWCDLPGDSHEAAVCALRGYWSAMKGTNHRRHEGP
jgi:hypothetical protein